MARYLTTTQIAEALGLADSTIRHYRASGRIVPNIETPGGHARYDLDQVAAALGVELAVTPRRQLKGLTSETFEPVGVHRLPRSQVSRGEVPQEIVALGAREVPEPAGSRSGRAPRWGGKLLSPRHAFPDELENRVLRPLRDKIKKAMGKSSPGGQLASALLGVWSSTEWAPSVSIMFVVDENRLLTLNPDLDLGRASDELIAPARKILGKEGQSIQVVGTVTTLAGVSAHALFAEHRQIDLDELPVGQFIGATNCCTYSI